MPAAKPRNDTISFYVNAGNLFKQRAAIWGNYAPAQSLFNDCALFPKPAGMRWEAFSRKVLHLQQCKQAYYRAFSPVVEKITGMIERRVGAAAKAVGLDL